MEPFEARYQRMGQLVVGGLVDPVWHPDGKHLGLLDGALGDRSGWLIDIVTGERQPLVDIGAARAAVQGLTGIPPAGRGLPFERFAFLDADQLFVTVGGDEFLLDRVAGTAKRRYEENEFDALYGASERLRTRPQPYPRRVPFAGTFPAPELVSPPGDAFLAVRDDDLVVRHAVDGRVLPLTDDGSADRPWSFDGPDPGLTYLGSSTSTSWSPSGTRVAAYRHDLEGVARVPVVHHLKIGQDVEELRVPRAGGAIEDIECWVLDVAGGRPVRLDTGPNTGHHVAYAGWLPDESALLLLRVARDGRSAEVLAADPRNGVVRLVLRECGDTFVRIHHDIYTARRLGLWLLPDGQHLLWASERSGWRHLYVYDLNGPDVRQLTSGEWPVDALVGVLDGQVFFTASADAGRPYDRHLYRVPLSGGDVVPLTDVPGVHEVALAPSGEVFVDTLSRCDIPPRSTLRRATDGGVVTELTAADAGGLHALGWTPPEQVQFTAGDGFTDIWGVVFRPCDYRPDRRYPVVEMVYAGPQVAVAPHAFATRTFLGQSAQALAELGCVVLVVDGRGTPGRSKAFHDAVFRDWAGPLVADHAAALTQLLDRDASLDPDRVAVLGHSWGGYAAFRLALERPDVYAAAVCSAPAVDLRSSLLSEPYLGTPQDQPAAYEAADILSRVHQLQRPVLLACGTSDGLWPETVRLTEALVRASKEHEVVVLPGARHGYDLVHDRWFWRRAHAFLRRHVWERTVLEPVPVVPDRPGDSSRTSESG